MSLILLDKSVCVDALTHRNPQLQSPFEDHVDEMFISSLTASQLYDAAEQLVEGRTEAIRQIDSFIAQLGWIDMNFPLTKQIAAFKNKNRDKLNKLDFVTATNLALANARGFVLAFSDHSVIEDALAISGIETTNWPVE